MGQRKLVIIVETRHALSLQNAFTVQAGMPALPGLLKSCEITQFPEALPGIVRELAAT